MFHALAHADFRRLAFGAGLTSIGFQGEQVLVSIRKRAGSFRPIEVGRRSVALTEIPIAAYAAAYA